MSPPKKRSSDEYLRHHGQPGLTSRDRAVLEPLVALGTPPHTWPAPMGLGKPAEQPKAA